MKRALVGLMAVAWLMQAGATAAVAQVQRGLIPPPPIYIPYGGKIVTEVHLSDNDVLGIVKQVLPAVGEVVAALVPMAATAGPADQREAAVAASMMSRLDFKELTEAISGIKNVRFIAAVYPGSVAQDAMLEQLDAGVAKAGTFSKVLSDMAFSPGVFALYAAPDNGGYMGFAYDPGSRMLYGIRIVGFVDVAKFTRWAVDAAKMLMANVRTNTQPPTPQPAPEPAPANAPEEPQPEPARQ